MKKLFILPLIIFGMMIHSSAYPQEVSDTLVVPADKKIKFALYPAAGYSPETSAELGIIGFLVIKNKEKDSSSFYRPTSISPYFLYTFNNQILSAIDLDVYFSNGLSLNSKVRYYNYPDFFYGIGNDTSPENDEIYTNEYVKIDGRILKPLNTKWFVGLNYNLQYNSLYDFEDGGQLLSNNYTGEKGGWSNGAGLSFLYDSRNSTLYPSSGSLVRVGFISYTKVFGSDYKYTSFLLDARKFWKIKNDKNIIGWQGYANLTAGSDIPFYNLNKIGGDDKLRGIENANLYTDRQAWYTQVEYRRDLFWRFGAVVFAGVGDVADKVSKFQIDETKYVFGVGGRFQALKDEKFNIRLDVGVARYDQKAFYLSIREAF